MQIVKIHYTKRFIRDLKKLSISKKQMMIKRERIFKANPFAQTLKTHQLRGNLNNLWSFSLTHQDRVIFDFISDNEVIFYKVGSHDIYK